MPPILRRASAADAATIVDFNCRLALESEGKTLDTTILEAGVAAGLADEGKARYFVAEDEGHVVGQLMLTLEWSDWRNGWVWWIQSVDVHPELAPLRRLSRALPTCLSGRESGSQCGRHSSVHGTRKSRRPGDVPEPRHGEYELRGAGTLPAVRASVNNRRSPVPHAARP